MKKAVLIAAAVLLLTPIKAQAKEPELVRMNTTAYCQGHTTATGKHVHKGICAVSTERLGKTALVYKADADGTPGILLGIWECEDTGFGGDADGDGIGSIEEGKVIDMYFPTYEECQTWMRRTGGTVYVQFIDAVG